MAKRRPSEQSRGAVEARAGVHIGAGVWIFQGTAAPTDGASGTGAGFAGPGSLYVRTSGSNSKLFINTGTKAAPTWTVVGTQS